ncbi:MAG: hypothetical protein Q4G14_05915 [Paracoccus sp. (in: a-proteobacteria)]|uniref:hypothetical protein n=1 Tax=Paracoccus sp. TaxID=267 RepID=UPI0026E0CEC8|nr:hypothetical protein [Paracoccus sp. (in: a-proteobacteria)]MDO5612765.1 hypothetical protein [Paracoccus sp. (in: a-proteobacteria)]
MSHEDYAYTIPRPMTAAQKAAALDAAIEQARLQGAEIVNEADGSVWAVTGGFPGIHVKRRLN